MLNRRAGEPKRNIKHATRYLKISINFDFKAYNTVPCFGISALSVHTSLLHCIETNHEDTITNIIFIINLEFKGVKNFKLHTGGPLLLINIK